MNENGKPNESRRPPHPGDFLRDIGKLKAHIPDPIKDFGMYQQMDTAFKGLHEYLDKQRSNYGRVGYSSQNLMSDLSKAYIEAIQCEDEEEVADIQNKMKKLNEGLNKAIDEYALPENFDSFSRTIWQERHEAELFGAIWPIIIGKSETIPQLIYWKDFQGNIQAYLYAFLDVITELAKAVDQEVARPDITTEYELRVFERYLAIAESIALCLSQERHIPGYVISNGFGRWMAYSKKLRTAYGAIAHVRKDLGLRYSIQRMIKVAIQK